MDRGPYHKHAAISEQEFEHCINGDEMREIEARRLRLNGFDMKRRIESEWVYWDKVWIYKQTIRQ